MQQTLSPAEDMQQAQVGCIFECSNARSGDNDENDWDRAKGDDDDNQNNDFGQGGYDCCSDQRVVCSVIHGDIVTKKRITKKYSIINKMSSVVSKYVY